MANQPASKPVITPANIHPDLTTANIETAKKVILALYSVSATGKAFTNEACATFVHGLIDTFLSGVKVSSGEFDENLTKMRDAKGDDFLPKVVHFRKPREDKKATAIDIFSARSVVKKK